MMILTALNASLRSIAGFVSLCGFLFIQQTHSVCADEIRVMSFNIRYGTANDGENHWDKRKEFVAETITTFNPDLLGTQETLGFQKQYLAEQLSDYTSIGIGRDDGGQTGEMTAIFFKTTRFEKLAEGHFWLSETPEVPGSKSWDSSLPRICSWVKLKDRTSDQLPILFINTHFDHRGEQARQESAKLIRQRITRLGRECRTILTGDFNATVESAPYHALFDDSSKLTNLTDTYRAVPPQETPGEATFSGFKAGVNDGPRIDWIAVSNQWGIVTTNIDRTQRNGKTPSDHHPVNAVLQEM